jgi:hypothetical protein
MGKEYFKWLSDSVMEVAAPGVPLLVLDFVAGTVNVTGILKSKSGQAGATFTDVVTVSKTITESTASVQRLSKTELTITPDTTFAMSPATDGLVGARGAITLTTGKSITAGYLYGTQGKVILDGATVAIGSAHLAGVYGQLSMSGTTLTNGHIAGVIADIQATPTSAYIDLFYGESATGNVINSMFKAFGKSTYVFDLASNTHTQMGLTGAATTPAGWLKILVEGQVRYINLLSTAP